MVSPSNPEYNSLTGSVRKVRRADLLSFTRGRPIAINLEAGDTPSLREERQSESQEHAIGVHEKTGNALGVMPFDTNHRHELMQIVEWLSTQSDRFLINKAKNQPSDGQRYQTTLLPAFHSLSLLQGE